MVWSLGGDGFEYLPDILHQVVDRVSGNRDMQMKTERSSKTLKKTRDSRMPHQ